MIYKIEHKILTLSQNAVMNQQGTPPGFVAEGITFSHWDFNYIEGWKYDFWLAEGEIDASNAADAINQFRKSLERVVVRVALIGQSYIEYDLEPWLVRKEGSDTFLYRHINDGSGVGLMFQEEDRKALQKLLENKKIPEAFYYYWNDAVNSIGYCPKLLLMFSAIESLVKKDNGKKDWDKIKKILGEDLAADLFGTKGETHLGLRNRLVHGEYFDKTDTGKNYLELVHKKVISYFNDEIIKENLITLDIVHPQRHFFGNKTGGFVFLNKKSKDLNLDLKYISSTFGENGPKNDERYEIVYLGKPASEVY